MSSPTMSPGLSGQTSAPVSNPPIEPTASNPATGNAEEKADQDGLLQLDRDNLLRIRRMYKEKWTMPRRAVVRNILKKLEYLKGNQYYVVGPDGFSFQDPFSSDNGSGLGNEQGRQGQEYYRYVTNIIQWFERGLVSTIAAQVTAIRFQPANAQSDRGNRVAQEASRANAYIERLNDEKALLEQKVGYLAMAGSYFVYTRPVRDDRIAGDRTETVFDEQMQEQQVKPDRYMCPGCGAEAPADQSQPQQSCPECGSPMGEQDFYPGIKLPMPTVQATKEVPQMQVRKSLYNGLHVDADPNSDSETGDPLLRTPILDLSVEIDIGSFRAMYPEEWDTFQGTAQSETGGDNEVDRMARARQYTQNNSSGMSTRGSNTASEFDRPTYSRTWMQPEAFNRLEKKEEAEKLKQLFPKGCCVMSYNGKFLGIRAAQLTKEWTWGGTRRGFGLYPPALLEPAMDFQDRLNDAGNTEAEFYDRMAVPGIAYDSKAIAGKGWNGKYWPPGAMYPVPLRPKDNRKLSDVMWQPTFHKAEGLDTYQQRLITMAQMIVAVPPQIFGQTQSDIDTFGGQKQALGVAKSNLGLAWSQIRGESARTAQNAVRCLVENATSDLFDVIKTDDGQFKNQPIDLDALKNELDAYPEEEQGFPESHEQMVQRWQEIITEGKDSPLVMELLKPMKNRRMVIRGLIGQDVVIPDEDQVNKVLKDITKLLQGVPAQALDPMTQQPTMLPSVLPDKDVDDMSLTQQVVKEYLTPNYWDLKESQPDQFQNVKLYLQLAAQFEREQQIQAAGPPQPGAAPPGAPAAA